MIRIGVLGTSGIAERRMIPALRKEAGFAYAGVAWSTREEMGFAGGETEFAPLLERKKEKAERFQAAFGGKTFAGYETLLRDPEIQAVYIALPPALHEKWIGRALEAGKHVLAEKPFTTRGEDTRRLLGLAEEKDLAVIENYGFPFHGQMGIIREWLSEGAIGEIRQVRATFGFPHRDSGDFRYDPDMGGGALLDCGGYTVRAASAVLGPELEVLAASAMVTEGHRVDVTGNALLRHRSGVCAQLAFGMDHDYRCELEIWGSRGTITAPRIFTAPDGFPAPVILRQGPKMEEKTAADDQFQRIAARFLRCIEEKDLREKTREEIRLQGDLTDRIREMCRLSECR